MIAIKAPSGTTLEVPDPDEGMEYPQRRYQIYLKSHAGPIEVFLVSHAEGAEAGDYAAAAAAGPSSSAAAYASTASPPAAGVAPGEDARDGSGGRRSSKRARSGSDSVGGASPAGSPASSARRAVSSSAAAAGGSSSSAAAEGGQGHEGLLKLDPVGESETDYWASAPTSQELGIADLYFNDSGDVKVEA